jgi:hypothetical protein
VAPEKCHVILFLIKKLKSVYLENLKIMRNVLVTKWSTSNNFYFGYTYIFLIFFEILSFAWSMTVAYLRNSHYELSNIIIMFKCKLK